MSRRTLVCGLVVLSAVLGTHWLRLNVSPSVPLGLYLLRPVPALLHQGDLVVLPTPASVRPWHSWWVPLLKPVAATAGARVCHQDNILFVHGVSYGLVYHKAHGKPLSHLTGCLVVQAGEVFLASAVPKSLDSRYYGPVPVGDLTAQALPRWTWR
jgi:type IV secretory pathway protease TraF